MASLSTWILSLKILLISSGVLFIAMVMKFSVPLIIDFAIYEVPVIWTSFISWLKPPYLYVIINAIIITIAASSRFFRNLDQSEPLVQAKAQPSDLQSDFVPVADRPEFSGVDLAAVEESEGQIVEVKAVVVNGSVVVGEEDEDEDEDEVAIPRSTWTPLQRINSQEIQTVDIFPVREKPLVSARFGHRKLVKASPEGARALRRVAKPKKYETLENTWKTITDGRHMPLTRHLKKSDTCQNYGRQFNTDQAPQNVLQAETFNDLTNSDSPVGSVGKLRKEASLSQDELNRRVEAFIKRFNDEMRLQRQESLNQYTEMINRGAH